MVRVDRRKRRLRFRLNARRLGRVTAALAVLPAIIIGRMTVGLNTPTFWVSVAIALWAEYRLGWMN